MPWARRAPIRRETPHRGERGQVEVHCPDRGTPGLDAEPAHRLGGLPGVTADDEDVPPLIGRRDDLGRLVAKPGVAARDDHGLSTLDHVNRLSVICSAVATRYRGVRRDAVKMYTRHLYGSHCTP